MKRKFNWDKVRAEKRLKNPDKHRWHSRFDKWRSKVFGKTSERSSPFKVGMYEGISPQQARSQIGKKP